MKYGVRGVIQTFTTLCGSKPLHSPGHSASLMLEPALQLPVLNCKRFRQISEQTYCGRNWQRRLECERAFDR